jgi:hypothetical protein
VLLQIPKLLTGLLSTCPTFIPPPHHASLTPGLVRVLHTFRPDGEVLEETAAYASTVTYPLFCLSRLMDVSDQENPTVFWKPAIEAGVVPVFADLLATGHLSTIMSVLLLAMPLLNATPSQGVQQWAGGLPRAMAGLMSGGPPTFRGTAVEVLVNMGMARPDLIADIHTWGLDATLRRLNMDPVERTAAAAEKLLLMIGQIANVSSCLSHSSV